MSSEENPTNESESSKRQIAVNFVDSEYMLLGSCDKIIDALYLLWEIDSGKKIEQKEHRFCYQ